LLLVSVDSSMFDETPVTAEVVRCWAFVALLIGVLTC